jgi:hypothetical protein
MTIDKIMANEKCQMENEGSHANVSVHMAPSVVKT